MTADDPWANIDPPPRDAGIKARRVPDVGTRAWGIYWAVDSRRHCLLILQHQAVDIGSRRLPNLRGLRVETRLTEKQSGARLIIRLTDGEQRELFHRFCTDIIEATRPSCSEEEAVERFLVRTWRWHHLLRGGRDARLNQEQQKGIVGELYVLERYLLPVIGAADAVLAWTGPIGSPKDFHVGNIGIEAKTCSPQAPTVGISSAEQLDTVNTVRLFLHVAEISGPTRDSTSVTITEFASRVRNIIAAQDISVVIQFEERLSAAGFDWKDDYSDNPLLLGDISIYEIVDGFPKITPAILRPGVEDVRYSVILSLCESFRIDKKILLQAISGEANGC